ncbi:phosphoadenosine phosphosulfate reductase domain-containing protein [Rhodococcus baikonurensis]
MMTATPDGLNMAVLNSFRPARHDLASIRTRIAAHLEDNDGYVAFSGGKDSLVVLHLALSVEPNVPVVFFDSGAEFPETYEFVQQIAQEWKLNFQVYAAEPSLLEILASDGGWQHGSRAGDHSPSASLQDALIAEPSRRAHTDHGPGEMWGVRADESAKGTGRWSLYYSNLALEIERSCRSCCATKAEQRRAHGGSIARADKTRAYGPVWDWTRDDVWGYIARRELPANPIYDKMRGLGVSEANLRVSHLVDGHFLEQGRATWLRRGWPTLFEEIADVLPRIREYV